MTKVITCYVHTSDREDIAISAPFPGVGPLKCKPVVNWYKLVLELAKDFGLDLDFFKRHHVVELYSCGHDKEAEEVNIHIDDSICRITLVIFNNFSDTPIYVRSEAQI